MSVENKPGGGLRLACDGEWCARKFSPQTPLMASKDLRWRATTYGWLTSDPAPQQQPSIPGVDSGGPVRDFCPECRRKPS